MEQTIFNRNIIIYKICDAITDFYQAAMRKSSSTYSFKINIPIILKLLDEVIAKEILEPPKPNYIEPSMVHQNRSETSIGIQKGGVGSGNNDLLNLLSKNDTKTKEIAAAEKHLGRLYNYIENTRTQSKRNVVNKVKSKKNVAMTTKRTKKLEEKQKKLEENKNKVKSKKLEETHIEIENCSSKIKEAITQQKNIKEKINNFNIKVEYISQILKSGNNENISRLINYIKNTKNEKHIKILDDSFIDLFYLNLGILCLNVLKKDNKVSKYRFIRGNKRFYSTIYKYN